MIGRKRRQQQGAANTKMSSLSSPTSTTSAREASQCSSDSDSQYASPQHRHRSRSNSPDPVDKVVIPNAAVAEQQLQRRRPTRCPDPLVTNRNALLARENRRKKKEHMAGLEQDVGRMRDENRSLRHQLRANTALVHQLREDRLYLRSLIANKTAIVSVLQTLRGNRMTSSLLDMMVDPVENEAGGQSSRSSSSSQPISSEPSTKWSDSPQQQQQPSLSVDFDALDSFVHGSSSSRLDTSLGSVDIWMDQLFAEQPLTEPWFSGAWLDTQQLPFDQFELPRLAQADASCDGDERDAGAECMSVCNEQNYCQNHTNNEAQSQTGNIGAVGDDGVPGICLHLAGGRMSLELCGSCHRQAQNARDEVEDDGQR